MKPRLTMTPGESTPARSGRHTHHAPRGLAAMAFGGDYNPEQWPEATWDQDVALMREAGVTMMTVGVFAWALIEPRPGEYDFDWLDAVFDRLESAGILVDLATPTASPPPWFSYAHPDSLPMTRGGHRLALGAREHFCPSSPAYRQAATSIARALAEHFGERTSLAMWHVNNEYGAHPGPCYCPTSAAAFRVWLKERHGDLDRLNTAWGTTFWGQNYIDWQHIDTPRRAPMPSNPAQQLDFLRFSNEEFLGCFKAERDVLHELTPDIPVTTNFMANNCKNMDYWQWAGEVDLVTNDHYLVADDPDSQIDLAMSADLTRGLAGGQPWLLLEHSTGAVNWQPRNLAKRPGEMRRNSLSHIARGSQGAMFFQWRASRFGAEKFHSAMVPQGGTDTQVWRDVCDLGAELSRLGDVLPTRVRAEVAMVWDWQSWWALELEFRPTVETTFLQRMRATYEALWHENVTVDMVDPTCDLAGYRLVVVPSLYLVRPAAIQRLTEFVEGGGHLVVSYFSGIVDEFDCAPVGPYPGMLRDLLGVDVEELHPLAAEATVTLDDGATAQAWSERVRLRTAVAVTRFSSGPDAGSPAVTRCSRGAGVVHYVATRLAAGDLRRRIHGWLVEAEVASTTLPDGVEVVHRDGDEATFAFLLNHTCETVMVEEGGVDAATSQTHEESVVLAAGAAVVLRQRPLTP